MSRKVATERNSINHAELDETIFPNPFARSSATDIRVQPYLTFIRIGLNHMTMKVLCIGGTGFLGRYIAREAITSGIEVTIFSRGFVGNFRNPANLPAGILFAPNCLPQSKGGVQCRWGFEREKVSGDRSAANRSFETGLKGRLPRVNIT
jgi:hypothetical protein